MLKLTSDSLDMWLSVKAKETLLLAVSFFFFVFLIVPFTALGNEGGSEHVFGDFLYNPDYEDRVEYFRPHRSVLENLGISDEHWIRFTEENGAVSYYRCADNDRDTTCYLDAQGSEAYNLDKDRRENAPGIFDGIGEFFGDVGLDIAKFTVILFFHVAMWALGLAGTLLEFSVSWFVLGMAYFINPTNGIITAAVQSAWTAIRDVANLAFIGGLVWASISMILNLTGSKPTAMIVRILIAALLVNFSFFFAGVIIDASNFLSKAIYEAGIERVATPSDPISLETGGEAQSVVVPGVGGVFMNKTRLASVLNPEVLSEADPTLAFFLSAILGIILFGVTAYVFFMATFLLTARFIVLVILLITSPIGVIRWTGLPMVESFGKRWWDALISQSLFAPIFFLFVGISFVILTPLANTLGSFSTLSGLVSENINTTGTEGAIALLALFTLAIGFMWASLVIARQMSSAAKDFAPIYSGANRVKNWAVSGLGTANRYAGGVIGGLPGAVIGGAMGTLVGKPAEGWKTGQRIGTNLYGRATTPLNIVGEKAAADIAAKPVFTDKAQKYYEKKVPNPLRPKTVSYGSDDFEKLVRELNTMDDEKLKEKFLKDTGRNPKMADVMINAVDPERRDMLRNAKNERSEQRSKPTSTRQSLDGDSRIKKATDEAREKDGSERGGQKAPRSEQQSPVREFAQLQKDLAEIRESSAKTADNTSRSVAEEKKQRVIEQLRNKEKRAVHEEYTNLDTPNRTTMREVVNEHVAQNPNDDQLKEIADTLRHIETSPAGMVAPQAQNPDTKPRKRRRIKKPKRDNKK